MKLGVAPMLQQIAVHKLIDAQRLEDLGYDCVCDIIRLVPGVYDVIDWGGIEEDGTLFNLEDVGVVIIPDGMWQPLEVLN